MFTTKMITTPAATKIVDAINSRVFCGSETDAIRSMHAVTLAEENPGLSVSEWSGQSLCLTMTYQTASQT